MNESGNELPDRGVYHGNSMSDVFADGDILIFSAVPFDRLECGDIVAVFERSPHYVHRIVRKTWDVAITMGDNNSRPDVLKLNKNSKFRFVSNYIPVGSPVLMHVEGGIKGMKQFRRQQNIIWLRHRIIHILPSLRRLGCLRIPAKKETRFRDGTIQWSFGRIPVAARNPSGRTKYLNPWKRLFFRIPKGTAAPPLKLNHSEQDRELEIKKGK
jgi:hypothetical protein